MKSHSLKQIPVSISELQVLESSGGEIQLRISIVPNSLFGRTQIRLLEAYSKQSLEMVISQLNQQLMDSEIVFIGVVPGP